MTDVSHIIKNAVRFIQKLKIIDKNGKLVTLKLNGEQVKIIQALESGGDVLIAKGRQIGSSTVVSAFLFWKAYSSIQPITIAILSHKLESSKRLLKMHKTFYDNLPAVLKRPLEVDNKTVMKFGDTGAEVIAVSAGGEGGLRSFTCNMLHMSEYAFSPDPEELKATAQGALNNGQLIIESTASHYNDALHQEIFKAERGEYPWNFLFFPWYEHEEYRLTPTGDEVFSDAELELAAKHKLDGEQLVWRKRQVVKLGVEKFRREYPATLEDAYAATGNTYLKEDDIKDCAIIRVEPAEMVVLEQPSKGDAYAIGVDVAAGVGRDYSVIQVVSKTTMSQVAIYRSNTITPVALALKIQELSLKYNNAMALVESNNYGNVVLLQLSHLGFWNTWKEDGKDWQTTGKSKTAMFENIKRLLQEGYVRALDNITLSELRSLQVNDKGLIIIPESLQSHGDSAIAIALAYICLDKVSLKAGATPFLPAWVKTSIATRTIQKSGVGIGVAKRY
jgi:hypothetical protein